MADFIVENADYYDDNSFRNKYIIVFLIKLSTCLPSRLIWRSVLNTPTTQEIAGSILAHCKHLCA
jgi:hypothetical protein